jgi:aminopeptidase N
MTQTATFLDTVADAVNNLPRADYDLLETACTYITQAFADYGKHDDYNHKGTAYNLYPLCSGLDNKAKRLQAQADKYSDQINMAASSNTGTEIDAGRLTDSILRKANIDNQISDLCTFRDMLVDAIEESTGERWTPYVPTNSQSGSPSQVSADIAQQLARRFA